MKMKMYSIYLLYLLFVLWSSESLVHNGSSYSHFQLVYTWPNTFCLNRKIECIKPVPQNFMLHGLWPADKSGKSLIYCSKKGDVSYVLRKYEKKLRRAWPTLRADWKNMQFWVYQWNKHGTCVQPKMNIQNYLQVIIDQKGRFKLLRALLSNNIHPDHGSSYPRSVIEAALGKAIGGRNFYISCLIYRKRALIKEIFICLDAYGEGVISCPHRNSHRGCGNMKELVFPAIN